MRRISLLIAAAQIFVVTLLANGEKKAEPIAKAIEGSVTAKVTASALQLHPLVTVIVDEAAASKLELAEYYRWVYKNKPKG